MNTTTQPPRPSLSPRAQEPIGNRPLPKGIVPIGQAQVSQPQAARFPGAPGPAARDSVPEGTLIVGGDIQVKGQIKDCQALIVEGRVEATLKADRLEVRKGGTFVGTAEVKQAVIAGVFEGRLQAGELLGVAASGRVRGEVRYARIVIEAGGEIGGNVDTLAAGGLETQAPSLAETGS